MSRHTKPHKCSSCSKPFSTHNDLERHMKRVHTKSVSSHPNNIRFLSSSHKNIGYRCAAPDCTKGDKLWPRLDNFRQHCNRIHKDHDPEELVRKSRVDPSHEAEDNGGAIAVDDKIPHTVSSEQIYQQKPKTTGADGAEPQVLTDETQKALDELMALWTPIATA